MVLWIALFGLAPTVLIGVWPIKPTPIKTQALHYVGGYLISVLLIAAVAGFYKDYASFISQ